MSLKAPHPVFATPRKLHGICAVLLLAVIGCVGCGRKTASDRREEDRAAVAVSPLTTVRTSPIGVDGKGPAATFALASATNHSDRALTVVLEGTLLDAMGNEISKLRPDELRMPPRGSRVFALVDVDVMSRPQATAARVTVRRAFVDTEAPPMLVTDAHVYLDENRVVLAGNLRNTVAKPAHVVVIGAFLDKEGTPMTRPFQVLTIGGETTMPVRMVGPVGSASGMLYLGEVLY